MEWLADNWIWVLAGIGLLLLVFLWGRSRGSSSSTTNRATNSTVRPTPARYTSSPSPSQPNREQEMAIMGFLLSKLTDAMESIVDDTVGRHYNKQDRHKIAMGMVAVMAAEEIPLDRMTADPALFAAVMIKSIATLTSIGQISAH
jgi:hypothetical protein